ncbi:MAG: hypothetical protein AB7P69_03585 [Candidatus Binatia bacterium]
MIARKVGQHRGQSDNANDYRRIFIIRVHQLLELGYRKLTPTDWSKQKEPAITGELVRSMEEVTEDPRLKVFRHFDVQDDPHINTPGRLGENRYRLDIKIVSSQRLPKSRFSFEAKRLGKRHPATKYVGPEGLGCFLRGDYASAEDDAGMLGYVQSDTAESWARKIQAKLEARRKVFSLHAHSAWRKYPIRSGPTYTCHTRHNRVTLRRPIDIYHTFLMFC